MIRKIAVLIIILLIFSAISYAEVADYLILQDIGPYKLSQPEKLIPGFGPIGGSRAYDGAGIISGADHFSLDHADKTYEVMYLGGDANASPTIKVEQHTGGDSDKWLLHEVDRDFRTYYGLPGDSYVMRVMDGNTIMAVGSGGWDYRWLSGNKVIRIEYTDLMMEKPEPIEVVKTYLGRHPSTLNAMTSEDLRKTESKTKWAKDEMDRRLWLCDKWFEQEQLGNTDQKNTLQEAVKNMNVFLDYREKYYGMQAIAEKNSLQGYLNVQDETNIKKKLDEYRAWWSANKSGSLIGRIIACPKRIYWYISLFFKKIFALLASLLTR